MSGNHGVKQTTYKKAIIYWNICEASKKGWLASILNIGGRSWNSRGSRYEVFNKKDGVKIWQKQERTPVSESQWTPPVVASETG